MYNVGLNMFQFNNVKKNTSSALNVDIKSDALNVRSGPGTSYDKTDNVKKK